MREARCGEVALAAARDKCSDRAGERRCDGHDAGDGVFGRCGKGLWAMGLAEVSDALWRERELLELLGRRLEEERRMLTSGRRRWLERAAVEVESVLGELRRTELLLAVEAGAVARCFGLPSAASLAALAAASGEQWRTVLVQHRGALLDLTAAASGLAAANRELASARGGRASHGQHPAPEAVLAPALRDFLR